MLSVRQAAAAAVRCVSWSMTRISPHGGYADNAAEHEPAVESRGNAPIVRGGRTPLCLSLDVTVQIYGNDQ